MSDSNDLRTRIAAVLSDHDPEGYALCEYHYDLADAVIRELGLREETCVMANHADHDRRVVYTKVPLRRYVTSWEPDE